MRAFLFDLGISLRRLPRSRSFVFVAAGSLALGIGAWVVLSSLVEGVLLDPLPYREPGRLMVLVEDPTASPAGGWPTSFGRLDDYNRGASAFAGGLTAARSVDAVVVVGGEAERLVGARVSGNLFSVLGVEPRRGRLLDASDAAGSGAPVVVLGEGIWRRQFAADPEIVGRAVEIDGAARTVVGIAPESCRWPRPDTDFWIPLVESESERNRGWYGLRALGRLADDRTAATATAELRAVATALDDEYPDTDGGTRPRLVPLLDDVLGTTAPALRLLAGAVLVVLLVVGVNFAGLLLARGAARDGEHALRLALGGGRRELVRLLLAEATALAVAGAVLGVGLGWAALRWLLATLGDTLPRAGEVRMSGAVVGSALAVALVAALAAAVVPALVAAARPPSEALRAVGKGTGLGRRRRSLSALVVIEVAMASTLAAGSGLLVRSLARLTATDPGFDPRGVATIEIGPPAGRSAAPPAETAAYMRRLLERLRQEPDLGEVSAISRLPVVGNAAITTFELEGRPNAPGEGPAADVRYLEPGAREILGIDLLAGRDFGEQDGAASPLVALVNRAFVRTHFPAGAAIGKRLWVGTERGRWRTVVGVIGDVHLAEMERPVGPAIFVPFAQASFPSALRVASVLARPRIVAPGEALERLRAAIAAFDARQAPTRARTLEQAVASSLGGRRFQATLLALFAVLGALLAGVGIYGVSACAVAERRDELGVRLALGADGARLARLMLGEALRLGALGLAIGALLVAVGRGVVARWLFEIRWWDPAVVITVAGVVALTSALAALVPAWRAARTAPSLALRGQ